MNTKSLLFNDKNIVYRRIKGGYWITLKSLCEALNVSYKHQFQRVKDDPILGPASRNHGMQVPGDNQIREYICLPEEYVYGNVKTVSISPFKSVLYLFRNSFEGPFVGFPQP